jgi:hypothetical protein
VTFADGDLVAGDREGSRAGLDDEHLGIGMKVLLRALPALIPGDEYRHIDVLATLEEGSRFASTQVFEWDNRCHAIAHASAQ